jgi:hypothetical protein
MLWNPNTCDMGIAIIRMLDLKIISRSWKAPYYNTYIQFTINNMYATWVMLWNLNTYDMGIAITRMLDLKITSTS